MTYLLASFHRFLVIVFNKSDLWIFRGKNVLLPLASIWIFSIAISSPFGMKHVSVHALLWRFLCFASFEQNQPGVYTGFIVLTAVCIIALNLPIFITVRKSSKKLNKKSKRQEMKIAKSLVLLNLYFYVTYVPWAFFFLLKSFSLQSVRLFYIITFYIGILACAINPLIYGLLFPLIGQAYNDHILCRRHKIAANVNVSTADGTLPTHK